MMRLFTLLSAVCAVVAAPCNHTFPLQNCTLADITDCAPSTSVFQIQAQEFGPIPPVPNENVTLLIQYIVPSSVTVTGGISVDAVSLNGIPVSSQTSNLCTVIPCPQIPGPHGASNSFVWPSGIATGSKILYTSRWYDEAQKLLLCSKLTVVV
jgi:hypothetical protein